MSNLLSSSGVYATYMSSFFGNLDSDAQQSLWEQYLSVNGLTTNPPQDTQDEQNFVQYLQGLYTQQGQSTELSPDATTQRSIITATFDTVLQMLTTLTNTVAEQANNLIFLGNYQNAYTQMLTNVPIYAGSQSDTWTLPNSSDPTDVQPLTSTSQLSSFTFGYDNISVQDIAQYMANIDPETASPASTQFVVWSNPVTSSQNNSLAGGQIGLAFQYVPTSVDSNGNPQDFQLVVSVVTNYEFIGPNGANTSTNTGVPPSVPSYAAPYVIQGASLVGSATASANVTTGMTYSQTVTTIENLFLQAYNSSQAQSVLSQYASLGNAPAIPWEADANVAPSSDSSDTAAQTSAQLQGQINTRNQEFVENARSYRTTIQNTAQAMQSNLSQTQQAISQQSDLLTSMLTTLNSLISAIFTPSSAA